MSDPPDNLVDVWRYVAWLDQAAYRVSATAPMMPGPVFQRLSADRKILSHWLCYTMDAQTDFRFVWWRGGPVISELVEAYCAARNDPLDVLEGFLKKADAPGKVRSLVARRQLADDSTKLEFTPRYTWMLLSIATTMVLLHDFENSIAVYLARKKAFLSCEATEIPHRIAFLLYLLTYSNIGNEPDKRPVEEPFRKAVMRRSHSVKRILDSHDDLDREYRKWSSSNRLFHKRLWAALRDYLKEGQEFHEHFQSALGESGLGWLSDLIHHQQDVVVAGLEVPGDVWNLRFLQRMFGSDAKSHKIGPRQLRKWFDQLRHDERLPAHATVESSDISFRYSPKMCDERREGCCVFRAESDIWGYCPPRRGRGVEWKGSPCPVTDHLCGIHHLCDPNACPVYHAAPSNLCRGCRLVIRENTTTANATLSGLTTLTE